MTHNGETAQLKKFRLAVKTAMLTHPRIRSVSALARSIRRPRVSVSRAINRGEFPALQKQISKALDL
jgi:hypothetical protein